MRIVIDMQGAQTESRFRGIGRYTMGFTQAVLRNRGKHEIILALSGLFPETIEPFRAAFAESIPRENILVWHSHGPVGIGESGGDPRRQVSELMREAFLASLNPDVIHVSSLFEGGYDNSVTSVGDFARHVPVSVLLYDLIPFINQDTYLKPNAIYEKFYLRKIEALKKASLCLAISDFTKQEAIAVLGVSGDTVVNVSTAIDSKFQRQEIHDAAALQLKDKFGIRRSYVLYTGGADERKNLSALIHAYADLSERHRAENQLVFAGKMGEIAIENLKNIAEKAGVKKDEILFTDYVSDEELITLYSMCRLFVFPSFHEGFGLPALEAMACGAPVIGSNTSSLPEVLGLDEALFDPFDVKSISKKINQVLDDESFRSCLVAHGQKQVRKFSWDEVAVRAIDAWRTLCENTSQSEPRQLNLAAGPENETGYYHLIDAIGSIAASNPTITDSDLQRISVSLDQNEKITRSVTVSQKEVQAGDSFLSKVPRYSPVNFPYVFSSTLCREVHFHCPLYTYWCEALSETPRFHRKQWEFVYICQTLFERGYLRDGMSAVGFGVGKEPLASYFAYCGVQVLATDLDLARAEELGWVSSGEHSGSLDVLNERGLCGEEDFYARVKFQTVDMNDISNVSGRYDICWSSCAFEHLGSIRKGLDFVLNSSRLLKPGGIAVHTTEYNLSSNTRTLENDPNFVIFRRCDIEQLVRELEFEGFEVEPIDFSAGNDELERHVDLPPYKNEPHIRLQLAKEFVATSIGLIIRAPGAHNQ